jgi:alpha-L-arabinofuranosidase
VLAAVLVAAPATPAAAANEQVSVNVATVLQTGTAGGARLGINTDYWWDNQANRVSGARTLPTALTEMGAKYWRYPGGEKADGYLWSTSPFTAPNPRLARISSQDWPSNDPAYWNPAGDPAGTWAHAPYDFEQFMTACRAANCIPVMVVAYDGIYKPAYTGGTSLTRQQALDTAKAWVNYANNVKGYGIKYWEIGNETWNPGYMGSDPGRQQQAADTVTFCQYMKQADSTILCGVNANTQADWNTLLAGAAPQIGFLSVHAYQAWPYASYADYFNGNLNQLAKVDEAWNALQAYPADRDRIKIAVTETGGITFGVSGTWTQGDLGHALMTFDTLAQFQQDPRVTFSQFWNTRWIEQNKAGNVWPGYPSSEYDALKPDNTLAPQGLAIKILAGFSLDRMVATTSTTKVRVFASYSPTTGRLNVWLINKSTSATTTTLTLNNYTPSTAAVEALTGTGPTDMNPVYLFKTPVTPTGNQLTVTLDRSSITILRF